jgi:cytochrome d ubiquinol oxidase subunit II
MNLNTIWFILIAVLYIGFFVLEGFDFGVGILLPFLSRDKDPAAVDHKRRLMINTIGPHSVSYTHLTLPTTPYV